MAIRHEAPKQKVPELHFQPEGYVDPDDVEFLEQFLAWLEAQNIPTENLVFTGLDGDKLYDRDGSMRRPQALFGMNQTGWRHAIETRQTTPAGYVKKDADVPLIALFDANQLMEPKTYSIHQDEDYLSPAEIVDINPGKPEDQKLVTPDDLVDEVVIHRDFPSASPTDALVGIVHIGDDPYKPTRDHGL